MGHAKSAKVKDILRVAKCWQSPASALLEKCIEIQQIPAPTGAEGARAKWVGEKMQALGLTDMHRDPSENNVYGRWPGVNSAPALLISAHTDTVFGLETDLTVRRDFDKGRVYGAGIGDNSLGVAAMLELIGAMPKLTPPAVDIWFAANSQEEGIGDLRGIRAIVDDLQDRIGAVVVLEGMGLGRIVHRALGSRRYRIRVNAPGGHSWSDFGSASALHVLALLAADITKIQALETPVTTYNIGRMEGGTSVNSIAQNAWLELDLRSEEPESLSWLIDQVMEIVQHYQRPFWKHRGVRVEADVIGDRPSGGIDETHPLVQLARDSLILAGYPHSADLRISSTDANIPLSREIPAICVGVTEGGSAHRLQEWIGVDALPQGMMQLLLLTQLAAEWLAAVHEE